MSNGIYKFENNFNHKIYIGQAANLEKRKHKHFLNIKDKAHQEDFYIALREYGWENFSYEILESFSDEDYDPNRLDELEIYWIAYYHSYIKDEYAWGYNMTPGGMGGAGKYLQKAVCQYSLKGDYITVYESISLAARILDINDANIISCCKRIRNHVGGYQWRYASENIKQLPDISNDIANYDVPVLQYDLIGNFINKYPNLSIAAEKTGFPKSGICQACKHKIKSSNEYQWRYINDNTPLLSNLEKRVLQIDKITNNIIQEFKNASEAARYTGINRGNIGSCLINQRKTAGGFIWKYKT